MKRRIKFVVLAAVILVIAGFIFWRNNNLKLIASRLPDFDSKYLKILHYKVRLFGLAEIGEASIILPGIKDSQRERRYSIRAEGGPSKFISLFFSPKASAVSDIDQKTSLPDRFSYSLVVPGVPTDDKTIIYDHREGTMELEGVKRVIFPNTQDPLSAMYFIRNQGMAAGKEFDINLNTNQKNYRFLLRVAGKKELLIRGRKVTLWLLDGQIGRRDKSRRHKTYIKIWFWEEAKVPVLVKTMTNGGQFVISLAGMEK